MELNLLKCFECIQTQFSLLVITFQRCLFGLERMNNIDVCRFQFTKFVITRSFGAIFQLFLAQSVIVMSLSSTNLLTTLYGV